MNQDYKAKDECFNAVNGYSVVRSPERQRKIDDRRIERMQKRIELKERRKQKQQANGKTFYH